VHKIKQQRGEHGALGKNCLVTRCVVAHAYHYFCTPSRIAFIYFFTNSRIAFMKTMSLLILNLLLVNNLPSHLKDVAIPK